MTERELQDYYEYYADGSARWYVKKAPGRDLEFERELANLSGGALRVVWGATVRNRSGELKYKQIWEGLSHFDYRDDEGNLRSVRNEPEVPERKLAIPVYARHELGRLRWMIEQYDRKIGDWVAYFVVETAGKNYRAPDAEVLKAIADMWHYNRETSEKQKQADDERREAQKAIDDRASAREEWHKDLRPEDVEAHEEETRLENEFWREAERQSKTITFS